MRRALTHVGGEVELDGEPRFAKGLAYALDVASAFPGRADSTAREESLDAQRPHVHGFHSYPARMHPQTAARCIEGMSSPGERVLDPFAGSGTVLVEALLAGRRAIGNDLNPLAVELSRLKTRAWSHYELVQIRAAAQQVMEFAEERRLGKKGPLMRYPAREAATFSPHVLLELDGLRGGIQQQPQGPVRRALELSLSSQLTKLSLSRGDSATGVQPKRIRAGRAISFFGERVGELCERLEELAALVFETTGKALPRTPVFEDDARELREIHDGSVDLVVTSPPYAATYDYLEHHLQRLRWLSLSPERFADRELGAKRNYGSLGVRAAEALWDEEMRRMLAAMARVGSVDLRIVLILGDSAMGHTAFRAERFVDQAARRCGLRLVARASQARPHFHGPTQAAFAKSPRREHALLLLRKEAAK